MSNIRNTYGAKTNSNSRILLQYLHNLESVYPRKELSALSGSLSGVESNEYLAIRKKFWFVEYSSIDHPQTRSNKIFKNAK